MESARQRHGRSQTYEDGSTPPSTIIDLSELHQPQHEQVIGGEQQPGIFHLFLFIYLGFWK